MGAGGERSGKTTLVWLQRMDLPLGASTERGDLHKLWENLDLGDGGTEGVGEIQPRLWVSADAEGADKSHIQLLAWDSWVQAGKTGMEGLGRIWGRDLVNSIIDMGSRTMWKFLASHCPFVSGHRRMVYPLLSLEFHA